MLAPVALATCLAACASSVPRSPGPEGPAVAASASSSSPATGLPAPATPPAALPATTSSLSVPATPSSQIQPGSIPIDARTHLAKSIDAYIAQPRFRHARWGIKVMDLDSGRLLYENHPDGLFIPASNAKLFTAALAMSTLGPDYRFHTSLYVTRPPNANGVMRGDILLYGRGDPGLGMADGTQAPSAWADRFAAALAQRGVRRITGNILADDTWYAGPPYGAGWEAGDMLGGYAAQVSALSAQDNDFTLRIGGNGECCTVRIQPAAIGVHVINTLQRSIAGTYNPLGLYRPQGSNLLYVFGSRPPTAAPRIFTLAAPDPARLAGGLLADALAGRGIRFDGRIVVRHWPQQTTAKELRRMIRITDVRSAALHTLVQHMLKESDNLYAQLLLLAVGKQQAAKGICNDQLHLPTLTANWGLCAMRSWLRTIGIDPASARFEEGSGLSRKDRITPAAMVRLLTWLSRQPYADDFRQALPVAGVDGTLQARMREAPTIGNLRAKTGTLRYAHTLSGYVRAANGNRLAFSIMLNGYARPVGEDGKPLAGPATKDIDAIATQIARYGMVPLTPGTSDQVVPKTTSTGPDH